MRTLMGLVFLTLVAAAIVCLTPRFVPHPVIEPGRAYEGAPDEMATIAYSPPVNGLAIALKCPDRQARLTQPTFTVYVRNTGSDDLAVCLCPGRVRLILTASDGRTVIDPQPDTFSAPAPRRADFVALAPGCAMALQQRPGRAWMNRLQERCEIRAQLAPPPDADAALAAAIETDEGLTVWRGPMVESADVAFEVPESG